MAHLIETMFYVGGTPWHKLGNPLLFPPPTGEDAMRAAGCDWRVRTEPLFLKDGREAPAKATVRETDGKVLGVVGERYVVLQNADAFKWFDPLLDEKLVEFHTGGSLIGGKRVWVLAKIQGGEADVAPGDPVLAYLLLSNSHDGTLAINVRFTPIRVVCHNTLSAALSDEQSPNLTIKHTKYSKETLAKVRGTVDVAKRCFTASIDQYRWLATRKHGLNAVDLKKWVRQTFTGQQDDEYRHEDTVIRLVRFGKGNSTTAVRDTCWALYNGVTDFVDHERGREASRLEQAWFGEGRRLKERALAAVVELAKAA